MKSHFHTKRHRLAHLESLEARQMLSVTWGPFPTIIGQPALVANYPWLTGAGQAVAIVDEGIDYNHPALSGGKHGSGFGRGHEVEAGYNFITNTGDPLDTGESAGPAGHGTGVAGIIGGQPFTLNGDYFQGLAPGVNIVALAQDTGPQIKEALDWIIANHATYNIQVVNLTDFVGVNTTDHDPNSYLPELQELNALNIFVATPVGNGAPVSTQLPATDQYVMGAGGINLSDQFYTVTQSGTGLDILAPAYDVTLPYFIPANGSTPAQEIYTQYGMGTSWASAHVGAAVLLKEIDPDFTPTQIMQILEQSGTPVLDTNTNQDVPRLQVDAAVALAYQEANDSFGNNHSFADAASLHLINGAASYNRLKYLIGRDNFYSFTVSKTSSVALSVGYKASTFYPDPTSTLLNSSGAVVGTIGSGATYRLRPGTYVVQVHSPVSLAGYYALGVSINGAVPPSTPNGNIGANSMAYGPNGQLYLAYYDTVNHDLSITTETKGVWSTPTVIDSSVSDVGSELSLAVDSGGEPGIAYYDFSDGDLKYAHFNGRKWATEFVDTGGYLTGQNPSLAFNGLNPAISYYVSNGGLRVGIAGRSGWAITTVDPSGGDTGLYSSLALNAKTDLWSVAYSDATDSSVRFATQGRKRWAVTVVDNSGEGGSDISLAYNSLAEPAFSYFDTADSDLRIAQYSGTSWGVRTIAANGDEGQLSYLYFNKTTANIVFYSPQTSTDNLATGSGKRWALSTLESGVGNMLTVAVDPGSPPTLAWLDSASGNLYVENA